MVMQQSKNSNPGQPLQIESQGLSPGGRRGRIAMLLSLVTAVSAGFIILLASDTKFLMPGPLTSGHVVIDNCSSCHANSGNNNLSWIHSLLVSDKLSDSKACMTCHKMPDTAFNPHGASGTDLQRRTERLEKVASQTPTPSSAGLQSFVFPTRNMVARGLNCATCHQEHKGHNFSLNKISNAQCRTCHVVKFDSFDGYHPPFTNYPFKRRTRIIYNHASHFDKHFPDVAKKDPAKRRPATCTTCHDGSKDKRVMSVTPFDQTCASCHLDQITGKERVSGPKGVAFLTLPGLDLGTLRQKNAAIGEWPDGSDAGLTPFMQVMISRNKQGRALIKTVQDLDLQDLSNANGKQIKAVTNLVWEIKGLFYELIKGKASDVLAGLNVGGQWRLSPSLIADLTASIPRDVVIRAHQTWLPNLATEIANRRNGGAPPATPQANTAVPSAATGSALPPGLENSGTPPDASSPNAETTPLEPDAAAIPQDPPASNPDQAPPSVAPPIEPDRPAGTARGDPQACVVSFFGQCMVYKDDEANPAAAGAEGEIGKAGSGDANFLGGPAPPPARNVSRAGRLGTAAVKQTPQRTAEIRVAAAAQKPKGSAAKRDDDLLLPTEDEVRALGARAKEIGNPGQPVIVSPNAVPANAAPANGAPANDEPATRDVDSAAGAVTPEPPENSAPAVIIQSDVDAETWAEYGGWYQQNFAVFYRPKGHKDKLIFSWLVLTGSLAQQDSTSPAAAVFSYLTSKDAQGSCMKCHSVDINQGRTRVVNFSPPSVKTKLGQFTSFIHEPHFSIMDDRGCLTCHKLEKGRPYLESYKQGDPKIFTSNFSDVKKELCQTCHTKSKARQDCLLCHNYHVNGVTTPAINTKIPDQ